MRVTVKQQQNCLAILGSIILIILIFGSRYYLFLEKEVAALANQIETERNQLEVMMSNSLGEKLKAEKKALEALLGQQSSFENPAELLKQLEMLTDEAEVELIYFKPESMLPSTQEDYRKLEMNIAKLELVIKGNWFDVITFFRLVDQLSPFLITEKLSLSSEGDNAKGVISLLVFYEGKEHKK